VTFEHCPGVNHALTAGAILRFRFPPNEPVIEARDVRDLSSTAEDENGFTATECGLMAALTAIFLERLLTF